LWGTTSNRRVKSLPAHLDNQNGSGLGGQSAVGVEHSRARACCAAHRGGADSGHDCHTGFELRHDGRDGSRAGLSHVQPASGIPSLATVRATVGRRRRDRPDRLRPATLQRNVEEGLNLPSRHTENQTGCALLLPNGWALPPESLQRCTAVMDSSVEDCFRAYHACQRALIGREF
jgi:hypothetical protein